MRNEGLSIHKALLWERTPDAIRCLTCERRCSLSEGQTGWCGTRVNREGTLYTLIYGIVSSLSANPIEKKPLHHFYPGSVALTAGSYSCNFDCPWCQNHHVSKARPDADRIILARSGSATHRSNRLRTGRQRIDRGRITPPPEFVSTAVDWGCQGTSISFNEPTLSLEWSLEVFRLARAQGLYNTYVTNGYMTPQALGLLVEAGLDAMNVDVKGDAQAVWKYCGTDVEKVWHNCQLAREAGVWLEITTLVVPGVNDPDEVLGGIAARIVADLGPDVPWHVSGYYPAYRFTAPPTRLATLERAWQVGREAGLTFVYLGNVPGHRLENTRCPGCGTTLVQRQELHVTASRLDRGRCPDCGRQIPGVW